MIRDISPPIHPWRNCPHGYYFVRTFDRKVQISLKNPDGSTSVREHCRHNPSGKDQLYPQEMLEIVENNSKRVPMGIGQIRNNQIANQYDAIIAIWVKYWNDIFLPKIPLSSNAIKALMGSESSFNPEVKDQKVRGRNFARGLMQITDETRKILADEKGELKDYYMTLSKEDIKKPEVAVSAAIRWLFHKKHLAEKYLNREATWEEAVAEYKSYLRRKKPFKQQQGMKNFFDLLAKLGAANEQ